MGQVTEKGQVTIPVELRRKYGLLPHTEVEISEEGGRVVIQPRPGGMNRGRWIAEGIRDSATDRTWTTEEIMAMTRGDD